MSAYAGNAPVFAQLAAFQVVVCGFGLLPAPMRHILSQVAEAGPARSSVEREDSLMIDIPGSDEGRAGPAANVAETRQVQVKVNGMVIDVSETVMVREMLTKAKRAGAIEGMIEEYILERVEEEGEFGVLGIDEGITVTELEEFLAVPTGRTEVA